MKNDKEKNCLRLATDEESKEIWLEAQRWLQTRKDIFYSSQQVAMTAVAEYLANTKFNVTLYAHLANPGTNIS